MCPQIVAQSVIDGHHRKTWSVSSQVHPDGWHRAPKTADFLFLPETDCDADTLTASGQSAWLRGKQNSLVFILFLENNYRLLSQLDRECYRITKIIVLQPGLPPSSFLEFYWIYSLKSLTISNSNLKRSFSVKSAILFMQAATASVLLAACAVSLQFKTP